MANVAVVPLPKTVVDLINQRKGVFEKSLNDVVEEAYLKLWDDAKFRRLIEGTTDSDCVEGSETCDDHEAAKMIRDLLYREKSPYADKKIHTFKLSLRVVMRRYRTSRHERRVLIQGERHPPAAE